jgi:hypothetical protein
MKKPEEADNKLRIYAPLKRQTVSELQSAITQETKLFVATVVITSHPAYLIFVFQQYFQCKDIGPNYSFNWKKKSNSKCSIWQDSKFGSWLTG